jgi:hypothetical protein
VERQARARHVGRGAVEQEAQPIDDRLRGLLVA